MCALQIDPLYGDTKLAVQQQFDQSAGNYVTSPIHADGPDLVPMVRAARLEGHERILDAGCGPGHTALRFARHAAAVVGIDLAESMLDQARRAAAEREITNAEFRQADVENLPFPDASFHVVTTRYSAHHWPNPAAALAEFHRVLRRGPDESGCLLLADVVSWPDFTVDTHFQTIELLRDPSHVRDHTVQQWLDMLETAGFDAEIAHTWEIAIDLPSWTQRVHTRSENVSVIRTLLAYAPGEVRSALQIQPDGSFRMQCALLRGLPR